MAAAVERRGSGAVTQGLEPEKGVEACPRKEELFLVLVWEAGLAPFLFFSPSDVHPESAASGPSAPSQTPHPGPGQNADCPGQLFSMDLVCILMATGCTLPSRRV